MLQPLSDQTSTSPQKSSEKRLQSFTVLRTHHVEMKHIRYQVQVETVFQPHELDLNALASPRATVVQTQLQGREMLSKLRKWIADWIQEDSGNSYNLIPADQFLCTQFSKGEIWRKSSGNW